MQKSAVNSYSNKVTTVGLLLDAAATTAVEQVADQVNKLSIQLQKNKAINQHGALALAMVTGSIRNSATTS